MGHYIRGPDRANAVINDEVFTGLKIYFTMKV
jgi:hypothetical protein